MKPEVLIEIKETTLRSTDFAGTISLIIANTGHSAVKYASIQFEENSEFELLTAPKTVYLGTLEPGDSANATFEVIAKESDLHLPATLSFRDSFNEKKEIKEELELNIINRNYYRDLPFEMWLAWLILGAVILALTIFYVRNMSKKDE